MAVPIPVAPVVVLVIFVSGVLIHKVGVEEAVPAVLAGLVVVIDQVFVTLDAALHPPAACA